MATVTVEFKVAMDEEQRKAKNIHNVKFECDFDGVDMDMVKRLQENGVKYLDHHY